MRKIYRSKLGNILIQSDGKNIIKCEFVDYFVEEGTDEIIEKCISYLDDYFSGKLLKNLKIFVSKNLIMQLKY